jgi:hypothetical protein
MRWEFVNARNAGGKYAGNIPISPPISEALQPTG